MKIKKKTAYNPVVLQVYSFNKFIQHVRKRKPRFQIFNNYYKVNIKAYKQRFNET